MSLLLDTLLDAERAHECERHDRDEAPRDAQEPPERCEYVQEVLHRIYAAHDHHRS